jgi:hypothetical protein
MARDPRKHQQKLARRKAKEKSKAKRKGTFSLPAFGIAGQLRRASAAPVLHSCRSGRLWEFGIGHVLISRNYPTGHVTFAAFLVDVFCLGVKDTFFNVAPRSKYERDLYGRMSRQDDLVEMAPEAARKLVEGAVAYAEELGLPPHPDYRKAREIFGDIDAGACREEFEYGRKGKPYFVGGPNDGPEKCRRIMNTLTHRLGHDGFHFTMPVNPSELELSDSEDAIIHIDRQGRLIRIPH